MKREVAVLSGNFRGELSELDSGEGIRLDFCCDYKTKKHTAACKDSSKALYRWKLGH